MDSNTERYAWTPTADVIERAQLTRFMRGAERELERVFKPGSDGFASLYRRSIEDVEGFTRDVLDFLRIEFDPPYSQVLDLSAGIAWARWCVGGGLNIAEACLAAAGRSSSDAVLVCEDEDGNVRSLSAADLELEVRKCAAGLRALGLGKGDAVGIHLPMCAECVVALLALGYIGAIAVPMFSGYGSVAIATRLDDVGARAIFTCDGFQRRGKVIPAWQTCVAAVEQSPGVEHVVVVRRLGLDVPLHAPRDVWFDDLLARGAANADTIEPERTSAEDPLMVLYSSGTTGRPKGIVHSHCGFPVKAAQDMAFGTDVGEGTRISWITDIGWMMGPWLIYGALLLGATIVVYDGAPDYPRADRVWQFVEQNRIEVLGISPTLVRALMTHGDEHVDAHDLSSLRILASTGEPWNPEPWWWLFTRVGKNRIPIINYSGGTEISGGILMGNPLLPIKPCSFSAPCPGIAADVVDDTGASMSPGEVGELAIRAPWIGMARGFWKDPERYEETYWSRVPGLWVHGDWARIDEDGHWYILGRSDDTLKIAGKRVGPAEVESVLVAHPVVAEAAVIGVPDDLKGTAMVAFCVPVLSATITPGLANELARFVGTQLGSSLRPQRVFFIAALPKTRNAKVMRRAIRSAFLREDPGDLSSLDNPDSLDAIRRAALTT